MRRLSTVLLALCVLLAVLVPGGVAAQGPTATAAVDAREVFLGQSLTLRVLVSQDGPDDAPAVIDMPALPNCTVTPRGRARGVRSGDGAAVTAYRFELTPRREGECRVPALAVALAGRTVFTEPLAVRVLPRPAPPRGLAGRDLYVDAAVSPEAPYVGQEARYTVRLYRAVAVATVHLQPPDAPGATLAPQSGQRDGEIEAGGRRYAVTEIDYRLTADRPGRLAVPPATAVFRGPAGRSGQSGEVTMAGPALAVTVRPLPPYDGAAPFTGLVGRLELSARLDDAADGRDAVYVLTLSGRGNLRLAAPPVLAVPAGLAARLLPPPKTEGGNGAAVDREVRVFRYALTASGPGDYVLPGPSLAIFDPEAETYRVVTASAVTLRVGAPPPDLSLAPPLRHVPGAPAAQPPPWPWRLGLALLPLLAYGLTFLPVTRRRRRTATAPPASPTRLAEALRQALDRSTDRQGAAWHDGQDVLGRLDRLLYAGRPAGRDALDAAVRQAGQALRRLET